MRKPNNSGSQLDDLAKDTQPETQSDGTILDLMLMHQRQAWRQGEYAHVETYLAQQPELKGDTQAVLDLIYNEIVLREEAGESPQLEDYLGRFPELTDELGLLFEVEGAIRSESSVIDADQLTFVESPSRVTSTSTPVIPGYEILEELGRGGMGVVYKARQLRLNRVVALKMILAGDHAPQEAALRFLAEAENIARLHHPHIVQIFSFGDCEGRPFFAMEYVGGGSLSDRLDGTPRQARESARLVETLARAIHEAHQLGIIHRDLKPANILLTADGIPKIADFGLAKCLDVETRLTRTQTIVGSPSYMAPEQIGISSMGVGPAADVYSLGAIIYELITGRPPFQAATILETLEQVRSDEPIAPRRLQPKLPRDLDTICLKCLEKIPARRYSSAAELADDLRRFELGQTIRARPVGAHERLWRWCRREPAIALLALALIAGLVGVATQWRRAESHLNDAIHQRRLAEENLGRELEANLKLQVAKDHEATAHRLAQKRFDEAMKAVRHFGEMTNDAALMRDPNLEGLRANLLRTALGFYREIQASLEEDASPEARSQLSEAYDRVAYISWELGLQDEALATYRRALSLVEQLADDAPSAPENRAAVAKCLTRIGFTLRTRSRPAEALQPYQQAQEIQQQLALENPAEPRYQEALSWTLSNIGVIHRDLGRPADAIRFHRLAIGIHETLVQQYPRSAPYRSELAWCWRYLSMALVAAGDLNSALPLAEQAASLHEELVTNDRDNAELRWRLARCLDEVGRIRCRAGRPGDAAAPLQRSAELYESVARNNPVLYRLDIARNQLNIAFHRAMIGRREEASACIRRAEDLLDQSSFVWPVLFYDLACVYSLCSRETPRGNFTLAERTTYSDRAIAALRQAIAAGYYAHGEIQCEPALDPLRQRRDFRELTLDLLFPSNPFQQ
jgi:tetratricopeptide (TPR) repeat protein/tRNA A-37 threonylcarbamoyl transferase component Bud32